jgi:hypothetical protein
MSITYDTGSANTASANTTTPTTGTITTAEDNELLLLFCFASDNTVVDRFTAATSPNTSSGVTSGVVTNPWLDAWAGVSDAATTTGADTTNSYAHAVKTTAGATGTLQCTTLIESRHGMIVGAFKLPVSKLTAVTGTFTLTGQAVTLTRGGVQRYARPDADVSDGNWLPSTPGDLYAMLDEEITADDNDYIYTTTASTCVLRLSNATDPGTSNQHVLRYRVRSADGSTLVVTLKQGATTIATRTHSALGTGWTTLEMTLSGAETDAITDYNDLTVTLEAQA